MFRYLADQILAVLQRRCDHPGNMVAADILEGGSKRQAVQYCRRCGSYRFRFEDVGFDPPRPATGFWNRPNPNLWRG